MRLTHAKLSEETIGFRLPQEDEQELRDRAKHLGLSRHDLAKAYVTEMLCQGEERAALREAITHLQSEIKSLRTDVALAVEALLSSAGRISEEKAQGWVKENLNTD